MNLKAPAWVAALILCGILSGGCATQSPKAQASSASPSVAPAIVPPKVQREFRAAWVATVGNSDWPSKPGLSTAEQKAALLAILDRAARLKLNAIIFQVRPACDAMYASKIEPWSEYLTGAMGKAPSPYYDPLEFAITEAHKRGIELHAWFNPYRAHHFKTWSPISANHVSKTRPQLVRKYGRYLWLDPGERDVQDYSLSVVMDVLKRYDVDGIHFDDYFYPYAEKGSDNKDLDFPDDASWQKFGVNSKLSRDDWRRENVNAFIERTYKSIKAEKPWVKFGVSPFGIWRPGYPQQIKGFDQYDKLYADARKWIINAWADYFAPQLYWSIEPKEQSFPVLLAWWNEQNPKRRHIWPGLDLNKALDKKWDVKEIPTQIEISSRQTVSAGHIHWNMKALSRSANLMSTLERGHYAEPALVPASPWLGGKSPSAPSLKASSTQATWSPAVGESPALWVVQTRTAGQWNTEIRPGNQRSILFRGEKPEAVAISAVNRVGIMSAPATATIGR